jgi:lipoyl-dependent peroxiredoxin
MAQLEAVRATPAIGKVIYTAKTHTTGGREHGVSRSSDGNLEVRLSIPGSGLPGTNPEQLLAAGWSACYESAIGIAARKRKIALPAAPAIDAEVYLHSGDSGYYLSASLNVSLPGIDREVAKALVEAADQLCPYSKALRGSIDVTVNVL